MQIVRRLLLSLALTLGGVLTPPVVAPSAAVQAQAALYGYTTDGILVYTWVWVPMPGQPNGGQWSLINVTPSIGL